VALERCYDRTRRRGVAKYDRLVAAIRREFEAAADVKYRESIQRFFKEPIDVYGVRTPDARRIADEYFKRVRHLPKAEIFEICEMLHGGSAKRGQSLRVAQGPAKGQSPFCLPATKYEEHAIAFSWAGKLAKKLEPADFTIMERWLKLHVSNWAACDTFCGGAVGEFLVRFPEFLPRVRGWAKSKNRWLRRAAAVALIPALKAAPVEARSEKLKARMQNETKGQRPRAKSQDKDAAGQGPEVGRQSRFVSQAYETADILLLDDDDMVQKGYGWMLKELANNRPREVLKFVMARKDRMPRTALRYATEKMPAAWKKRAMAR
jgi:3-methyladenine DNA glycosylase AlkD